MKPSILIIACLALTLGTFAHSADYNSKNNIKMKLFLTNYPEADASKDGVLTVSEMKEFILKNVNSSATSANNKQLKKFLNNAPKSDMNGDGVLKKSELIKYLGQF